jgi:asparagine synthase (glutamine-hydrolysing)
MRRALAHRGPDDYGVWVSLDAKCGLAHTRLAIVDLSPTGAQPMSTDDDRYHITFNGEIYNYKELRRDLEARGHAFRGHSDTEVLLHLFAERGARCLDDLDGMFAFAIYDAIEHSLFCARDPMGEKPLYVVRTSSLFAFSSEVRALIAADVVSARPDLRGIGLFLRQGSIPPPFTHVEGVEFVAPGTYVHVTGDRVERKRYYEIPFSAEADAIDDRNAAREILQVALETSVKRRLRSDVPVAAFLSGGLDSSTVAALMVRAGAADLRTFTITLPGRPNDESAEARAVADHLGTRHCEIPLELDDRHAWLDQALAAMDVPSIDGPNTWLVSRAVREAGLKVACSGLGGDELFFGYSSFNAVARAAGILRPMHSLRSMRSTTRRLMPYVPGVPRLSRAFDALLAGANVAALWFAKRGLYSERELRELVDDAIYSQAAHVDPIDRLERLGCRSNLKPKRQVSFYELSVYMHDQLLRDTDTMSMAHALEVRVPLIGRPVVDTVARLSTSALDGHVTKRLLREIAAPLLPVHTGAGPKQGFTLDWIDILRGRAAPHDPTAGGILRPQSLRTERRRLFRTRHGFSRVLALDVLAVKAAGFDNPERAMSTSSDNLQPKIVSAGA